MMFNKSFFSITPEAFNTVNIDLTRGESLPVVYLQVPISTKHQRIIAFEFVCVNNRAPSNSLNGEVEQCFCCDILDYFNFYNSISFKDAKDRDLIECTPASFPFASTSKVGLIKLNLPLKEFFTFTVIGQDGHPDCINRFEYSRITKPNLLGDFSGREFQLKELDDPEPLFTTDPDFIDPSSSKIMKSVSTAFTSISFTNYSVNFIVPVSNAETTVVFPT